MTGNEDGKALLESRRRNQEGLVQAAPDLLEALEDLVQEPIAAAATDYSRARAAIAKARGLA